jgi:hypothetical protein
LYTVIEKSSQEKKDVASSPRDALTTDFENQRDPRRRNFPNALRYRNLRYAL